MKASESIKREIRSAFAKDNFAFYRKAWECANALSTPSIMDNFSTLITKYSRPAIAVVLACSVKYRSVQGEHKYEEWANDILKAFQTTDTCGYNIDDNLHPSRIQEYAGKWIELNSD